MLVDTHCHLDQLDLSAYDNDLSKALAHARTQDVEYFLCVCINLIDFKDVMAVSTQHKNVMATVGLHPNEACDQEPTVEQLIQLANDPLIKGIGETGLDYYRSTGDVEWQRERFRTHIRAAKRIHKPIIVHTRQASADTIRILKEEGADDVGGIMHCFTESWEVAKKAMDLGFYISFSGIVTFPNAKELQEVAKQVPLNKMLLETDSPYLAPIPYRGKPNEPAYVRYVAEHIAQIRSIKYSKIADSTTQNFFDLFPN